MNQKDAIFWRKLNAVLNLKLKCKTKIYHYKIFLVEENPATNDESTMYRLSSCTEPEKMKQIVRKSMNYTDSKYEMRNEPRNEQLMRQIIAKSNAFDWDDLHWEYIEDIF